MITCALLLALTGPAIQTADYKKTIEEWRTSRAKGLQRPEGWLSVAGLFWLSEGANTVGAAKDAKVQLPGHSSPDQAATIKLTGEMVTITPAASVTIKVNDQPITTETELHTDASGKAERVKIGDVTFRIIQRGKRIGVRLYDPKSEAMTRFKGLHWYPVDERYVVGARFVPYQPPKPVFILNVLGDSTKTDLPGYVVFTIDGKEYRLDAEDAGDELFLNFQDRTNGKATYPAGRFLDVPKPVDGKLVIDFNKATNPPCAYTPFATCPLPPDGNKLDVEIRAGEMNFH